MSASGARSAVACFSAAKGKTDFPALLCSGAKDDSPVACLDAVRGVTDNSALLCSPNGRLKAVTRHDNHSSYDLPYPFRFPHRYPFKFPFPDPNRDPSQPPPGKTQPDPATVFKGA